MKDLSKVIFIGTGSAMAYKSFNTAIAIIDDNNDCFLIDAGGGNGIFQYLNKSNIRIQDIKNLFITHNHTDHILGVIWLIRKFANIKDNYKCNFYMSESVYNDLIKLCEITISKGQFQKGLEHINFNIIHNLEVMNIGNVKFTFFDTLYKKTDQFGCKIENKGLSIGFCGDVPLLKENFSLLNNVDILIHEALCDSKNAEEYKVYKKGHSTARDAGKTAKDISAKTLFLIHKSDEYINNPILYKDASLEFEGDVIVPEDGYTLRLN